MGSLAAILLPLPLRMTVESSIKMLYVAHPVVAVTPEFLEELGCTRSYSQLCLTSMSDFSKAITDPTLETLTD